MHVDIRCISSLEEKRNYLVEFVESGCFKMVCIFQKMNK